MSVILPGSTIGIFGGGQLGRMIAMAARSFGYKVRVLDPSAECPASYVVDEIIEAGWNDAAKAAELASACDVVTLEIEQIAVTSLEAAARECPVRPGAEMISIIQDKAKQKDWLAEHGFPVGPYRVCKTEEALRDAVAALGGRCFIKSATGGYDGRGQVKFGFGSEGGNAVYEAWNDLNRSTCVAEQALNLREEISVMVARSPAGEIKVYPPALNFHENQILAWSVIPAPVPDAIEYEARAIAQKIAEAFHLEGLLAVEMFLTEDGRLLVNELAPRPHNSYHGSERGCVTGQFEQAVRAVCNLPLGDVSVVQPTAIVNLLGEIWLNEDGTPHAPHFDAALAVPGVRLHLYEKLAPRKGRKMGHLSAVGATTDEARERALEARRRL